MQVFSVSSPFLVQTSDNGRSSDLFLVKCVTPAALARQNATLRASVALDIISDAFCGSHLRCPGCMVY